MTAHLLALAVGPVQEFIAAARRTRDLWFGSHLLSKISKAAAEAVQGAGGQLVFPAPNAAAELEPNSSLNVANVILAELHGPDPQTVVQQAKKAAQARWRRFADRVFGENEPVIRKEIWGDQVEDVMEFYAAWVTTTPETYANDRRRVMRLLDGRKNCRDFRPANGRAGVPKSSLDGLRESVLALGDRTLWPQAIRRRLRVNPGEQLDVIGVVKRAATGPHPTPSVERVAADPWIRGVINVAGADALHAVRAECAALGLPELKGYPHYDAFPYEGTPLYVSRHRHLLDDAAVAPAALEPLRAALKPLVDRFGEPSPYLAVLVADGDRMGQALSCLSSADGHRAFSRSLARFAGEARRIVEEDHQGVLVYAGGDDVLAFVPVDRCLACARALHDAFGQSLQKWSETTGISLTLSVGVAIAHFMDHLEDLLNYGRAAEKHAKKPNTEDGTQDERNGLAVHLHKRGGGPVQVRSNWSDGADQHLRKLAEWIDQRAISGRVAYDIRTLAGVYKNWARETEEERQRLGDAVRRDALSMLKGKQPRGEASAMKDMARLIDGVTDAASLLRLGNELLIARQLAVGSRHAAGRPEAEEVLA